MYDPGQYPAGQYPANHIHVYPPQKSRKWLWIGGGLAAVSFILICCVFGALVGIGGNSHDGAKGGVQNGSTSPKAAVVVATLNSPVRDGKFEFVVTAVGSGVAAVGDNPYLRQKAQGKFVVVSMTVENIADKPQSFSPSDQKLFDQQGRSFEPDTAAQIALGGSDVPVWDNINPGNTVNVKVVFDMPEEASPVSIELHDSIFSDGVKVSLV